MPSMLSSSITISSKICGSSWLVLPLFWYVGATIDSGSISITIYLPSAAIPGSKPYGNYTITIQILATHFTSINVSGS